MDSRDVLAPAVTYRRGAGGLQRTGMPLGGLGVDPLAGKMAATTMPSPSPQATHSSKVKRFKKWGREFSRGRFDPEQSNEKFKSLLGRAEDTRKLTDWDEGSRVRPQSPDYWAWSCWCGVDELGYPLWVVPTLSATLMYTDPLFGLISYFRWEMRLIFGMRTVEAEIC